MGGHDVQRRFVRRFVRRLLRLTDRVLSRMRTSKFPDGSAVFVVRFFPVAVDRHYSQYPWQCVGQCSSALRETLMRRWIEAEALTGLIVSAAVGIGFLCVNRLSDTVMAKKDLSV